MFVLWCLLAFGPGGVLGNTPVQDAVRATADEDAVYWSQVTLALLDEQIAALPAGATERAELEARRDWLQQFDWRVAGADRPVLVPRGDRLPWLVPEPNLAKRLAPRAIKGETSATEDVDVWGRLRDQQQQIWKLDAVAVRKSKLLETAAACDAFLKLLAEAVERLPAGLTREDAYWLRAHMLYRYGRTLAYRELPDVLERLPIEDEQTHDARLREVYASLREVAGERPEFVLLDIRMLRRDKRWGLALQILERYSWAIDRKWYLKKRRDILESLDWQPPHAEAARAFDAYARAAEN